jgi:F-type H+-transporting ATPase subunit b
LPGESLAAKSSSALIGASIAAWLVSKELYVVDAEFFEMLSLFGAYYIVYTGGKEGAIAYFEDRKNVI